MGRSTLLAPSRGHEHSRWLSAFKLLLVVSIGVLGALICWYYFFYDEGVRLGKQLGREAQAMRESYEDERVFTYRPLLGTNQQ